MTYIASAERCPGWFRFRVPYHFKHLFGKRVVKTKILGDSPDGRFCLDSGSSNEKGGPCEPPLVKICDFQELAVHVIVLIPVLGPPLVRIFIPPAMAVIPAPRTRGVQFPAPLFRFRAVPAVLFRGFVQLVIGMDDFLLTIVGQQNRRPGNKQERTKGYSRGEAAKPGTSVVIFAHLQSLQLDLGIDLGRPHTGMEFEHFGCLQQYNRNSRLKEQLPQF
jgi:hypothetical protein